MLPAADLSATRTAGSRQRGNSRKTAVIKSARCTGAPKPVSKAYPNVSAAYTGGITNSLQFAEKLLAEEFVAVVPGEAFGTNEHVRISYATSMENLREGSRRLLDFVNAHAPKAAAAAGARALRRDGSAMKLD